MSRRHPIHVLWAHPRSASTAFERLMRERGDLDCAHEPFLPDYYVARAIRSFPHSQENPDQPQTYEDIRAMLLKRADAAPLFIKDMAFYVMPHILDDTELLAAMRPVFMVRHPAPTLLSYARLDPDFTREEAGYEAQLAMHDALGRKPLIIRSEAMRADPEREMSRFWASAGLPFTPDAFAWDDAVPDDWENVKDWHRNTLASGRIRPPQNEENALDELAALGSRFVEIYDAVIPAYNALVARAEP